MLHNDISNSRQAVIGVRLENTLFNVKDGILPFSYRLRHSKVNKKVYDLLHYLYWETEMTVWLVVDNEHYTPTVANFLNDLPFGQIFNISSLTEVTMMLNTGDLSYFVDDDKIELHNLNSRYAVDFETFNGLLKRNRRVVHYET